MQKVETEEKQLNKNKKGYLQYVGILLLLLGAIFLIITYKSIILAYISYLFAPVKETPTISTTINNEEITTTVKSTTQMVIVDNNFGIYIPKIKANAKVIPNVDPIDKEVYNSALQNGIAHAKGTSFPNEHGNTFLFAHSAVNFYEQRNYNVYFYLLNELDRGDEIYISYDNNIFKYSVLETKIISSTDTKYLGKYMDEDTLTLMSCWPAGTNLKRIIVIATRVIE